eukprot:32972-Eustigmatos_ZCMA.PRE.1
MTLEDMMDEEEDCSSDDNDDDECVSSQPCEGEDSKSNGTRDADSERRLLRRGCLFAGQIERRAGHRQCLLLLVT